MAELITAVPGTRMLLGPDWQLRVDRVDDLGDGGWSALAGVRGGLELLMTRNASAAELDVEAWAGVPGESDGVAVIAGHGEHVRGRLRSGALSIGLVAVRVGGRRPA